MSSKTKKQGDLIWCGVCQKNRRSHDYLNGVIIHERDDVLADTVYMINEDTFYTKDQFPEFFGKEEDGS